MQVRIIIVLQKIDIWQKQNKKNLNLKLKLKLPVFYKEIQKRGKLKKTLPKYRYFILKIMLLLRNTIEIQELLMEVYFPIIQMSTISSHSPRELQLSDQISCCTGVSIVIVCLLYYITSLELGTSFWGYENAFSISFCSFTYTKFMFTNMHHL